MRHISGVLYYISVRDTIIHSIVGKGYVFYHGGEMYGPNIVDLNGCPLPESQWYEVEVKSLQPELIVVNDRIH